MKRLFYVKCLANRKNVTKGLYYDTKMEAKEVRDLLNGDPEKPMKFVVARGADHWRGES